MILAIEAASTDLSVAVADPDGRPIATAAWTSAQRQSAELLPRLLAMLAANRLAIGDARVMAVGTGPGSFTGLRVAMSLAKGLAAGLDVPIVGVPSLEAWLDGALDARAAMSRAGARDGFLLEREAREAIIVDRDGLPPSLAAAEIVAPTELADAFGLTGARSPSAAAAAIARRAADRAAGDDFDDLVTLEPRYLRTPRGVSEAAQAGVRWL